MPELQTSSSKAPAEAFRLSGGKLKLAAPENAADQSRRAVRLNVRSREGVSSWYWGMIYHELSGMTPAKDVLALDWCHDDMQLVGKLDQFNPAGADGFEASGELISVEPGDAAARIMAQIDAGIPYEASIFFDRPVIEEVAPGAMASVNGEDVTGPAVIVRKCVLRGVAVCPYGADLGTSTNALAARGEITYTRLSAAQPETEADMADNKQKQEAPAAPAPEAAQTAPAETAPRMFAVAELERMAKEFGAEVAVQTVAEGGDYAAAQSKAFAAMREANAKLAAERDAAKKQSAELAAKLANGGADPVPSDPAEGSGKQTVTMRELTKMRK